MRGENPAAPHEALFWRSGGGMMYAVRSGAMKLVRRKDGALELYDLAADPGEQHNLASAKPGDVQRLETLRVNWDAQLVPPLFPPLVHEPDGDDPIGRRPVKKSPP